jgi:hypothetical protein
MRILRAFVLTRIGEEAVCRQVIADVAEGDDLSSMKRIGIIGATLSVAAAAAGVAVAGGPHQAAASTGGFGGPLSRGTHPVAVWREPASQGGPALHAVSCAGADSGASCYSR